MDSESLAAGSYSQSAKSPERATVSVSSREHRVFVVPPVLEQNAPNQHKRVVDWSTVTSPSTTPDVPALSLFKLKDHKSEILQNVEGLGEGVTLIVRRGGSEDEDPFHMDPVTPEAKSEQAKSSDVMRDALHDEEAAAVAGDLGETTFPSLPFPLPTGPLKGKLESICEEEESTPGGADSDTSTPSCRMEERKRRWSTGDMNSELSPSPDGGLSRVRRQLEEVRMTLSPAGTSPRPEDAKDPRSYFSSRVWQKLEYMEQRVNKIEMKFFEAMDWLHIHVEEQLAERRSQEERARKEFTDFFVAALDSQQKAFSGGLTELQVVHGTMPRDASTGGTANPPPTVMCPVDPANVLSAAQDYAAQAAELLNAHLPAEIIEKHTKIHTELEEKLKALEGLGASPDPWEAKFDDMSPHLPTCSQIPSVTMQPSQEAVSPLRPSNGDESDFGKACNLHEVKFGSFSTSEWSPAERRPSTKAYQVELAQKAMPGREDSEAGHAGEEDVAAEGSIFTLRSPLPVALHGGSFVGPPQVGCAQIGAAITL